LITYGEAIKGILEKSIKVIISKDEMIQISNWVNMLVQTKKVENGFYKNRTKESLQYGFDSGYQAEFGVQKCLKINFIDWSIRTDKKLQDYNFADLKNIGLDIGVKTRRYGKFPLVSINPTTPEIITVEIVNSELEQIEIYICGYATVECLKKYSNKNFSDPPDAVGKKMLFFGYEHLLPFKTIDDLKNLLKNET